MMISKLIQKAVQSIGWMHCWYILALLFGLKHGVTDGILVVILWQLVQLVEQNKSRPEAK